MSTSSTLELSALRKVGILRGLGSARHQWAAELLFWQK